MPPAKEDAAELVGKVGGLTAELAKLLPRAQKALATQLVEVEQASIALRQAETKLAAREEACAAQAQSNAEQLESLKAREADLVRRQAEVARAPTAKPSKAFREHKIDSLSMQVLARATAAAMLKHGTNV